MSHVTFPYLGIEFDINRVAFSIGDFPVYWYGILIALGMLIGITLAQKNAKLVGLKDDDVLDVIHRSVDKQIEKWFSLYSFVSKICFLKDQLNHVSYALDQ